MLNEGVDILVKNPNLSIEAINTVNTTYEKVKSVEITILADYDQFFIN